MLNAHFVSALTDQQIEAALAAIDDIVTNEKNGKLLAIDNGKLLRKAEEAKTKQL